MDYVRNLETDERIWYEYYVDGLRKSKGNTYFIWLDGNLVYEFTDDDSSTYTYGHRLLYSDNAKYVLNAHGDVVALLNANGVVTKRYEYDAFGNELNIGTADTNPFRYCAEYFDLETGQIYLRNRYYQPVTGRFTQLDPVRDGLNWYAYCRNNPIMFVDPSGFTEYFINGNAPTFVHDEGFKYNPNAKATTSDFLSLFKWKIISEAAEGLPHLKDAAKMYKNYLSNTGEAQIIDYERAYKEDSVYKSYIDTEIENMKNAAKRLYENGAGSTFNFTGELFGIPNGDSENWQKTLGAHYAYGVGQVTINEETGMVTIVATFYTEDMYNFNPGQADIASGTKDAVNGRFAELGWAKEFITKGSFTTTIECNLSDIPIGSSINAPGGR